MVWSLPTKKNNPVHIQYTRLTFRAEHFSHYYDKRMMVANTCNTYEGPLLQIYTCHIELRSTWDDVKGSYYD